MIDQMASIRNSLNKKFNTRKYFDGTDGDILISSNDHQIFRAHIEILCAISDYFRNNSLCLRQQVSSLNIVQLDFNSNIIKFTLKRLYSIYFKSYSKTEFEAEVILGPASPSEKNPFDYRIDILLLMHFLEINVSVDVVKIDLISQIIGKTKNCWVQLLDYCYKHEDALAKLIDAIFTIYISGPFYKLTPKDIMEVSNTELKAKLLISFYSKNAYEERKRKMEKDAFDKVFKKPKKSNISKILN